MYKQSDSTLILKSYSGMDNDYGRENDYGRCGCFAKVSCTVKVLKFLL